MDVTRTRSAGPGGVIANEAAQRRRVYLASAIGSALEYYDFLIYATAASLVFGTVFFAGTSPAVGVIASFATLAVGYVARPLGGILFGHFGDRIGRKSALIWTLMLMGPATFLIGVLPTSEQIGSLAPILLITLRLIQGLAVGGEWGGSILMTVEHAKPARRGLLGSATQTGANAGLLLSVAAFAVLAPLSQEQFLTWGWRLPFMAAIALTGIGLYVRLRIVESPVFAAGRQQLPDAGSKVLPLFALLRERPGRVLLGVFITAGPFMGQAVVSSFLISYASTEYGLPRQLLLTGLLIAAGGGIVTTPLFALLSDRVGRRPVYLVAAALVAVHAFTMFPMVGSGSAVLVVLAFVISMTILNAAAVGTGGVLLAELFPTASRYTGISVAYQLGGVIGGGIGPLLAATFVAPGGPGAVAVSVMIAAFCAASVICVASLRETRQVDLHDA